MSLLIGPNGFHDGEAPDEDSYNEDGEDALNRLCDTPAYLVVGTDDDLIDNLPGWVDEVLSEHEALAEQAEKIGLEPSLYVTVPDRECNRELSDFLEELGFNVGSSYIERGPGSSVDGLVYVRNSKIPSLQKRADRELRKARKAVIRDGRKALKPGRVPADGLEAELDRAAGPLLVALHHPPVPLGGGSFLDAIGLQQPTPLLACLLACPQVRGLVFGHIHQHWQGQLARPITGPALPLWGCPSTLAAFAAVQPCPLGRPDWPGGRWLELEPGGGISTRLLRWPPLEPA